MKLSLVVPAYNEEENIGNCLRELTKHFKNRNYEIIVSDDGSTDNTLNIVKEFSRKNKKIKLVFSEKNKGKGAAVREGFKKTVGDVIVFTDADLASKPPEIDKLIDSIGSGADLAIGSRYIEQSKILTKSPLSKRIASKGFNFLVNTLFGFRIRDTQCGLKAMNRKTLNKIISKLTCNDWAFDVEMILRAKQAGLIVKEVPVVWAHKEWSTKFSLLKHSARMGRSVINLWLNDLYSKVVRE